MSLHSVPLPTESALRFLTKERAALVGCGSFWLAGERATAVVAQASCSPSGFAPVLVKVKWASSPVLAWTVTRKVSPSGEPSK